MQLEIIRNNNESERRPRRPTFAQAAAIGAALEVGKLNNDNNFMRFYERRRRRRGAPTKALGGQCNDYYDNRNDYCLFVSNSVPASQNNKPTRKLSMGIFTNFANLGGRRA